MSKKAAVVTGASSGIGKAIANELLNNGFQLVVNGRSCRNYYESNDHIQINTNDLTNPATAEELLNASIEAYGQCDYLFVNAGIIESGSIEDINIDKVCAMARLKVESSYRLIYTFLKYFKKRNKGHIFITSSVLGTKTRENSGAYAGCNYALEALAESLRMELSNTDVQITCIEPGLVQTNLHREWPVHPKELLGISHALLPEDIAQAVMEMMNKSDYIRIPRYMILPKGHRI